MTCICSVRCPDGTIVMGGDSAGVSGLDVVVRADPKVFFNTGQFLMGMTTSFRMGNLLRFSLKPPVQPDGMEDLPFMATLFVDAVRDCFKSGGYLKKENEQETGGSWLVAYKGTLYSIESDFQVGLSANSYAACGCGESYALGSLFSTGRLVAADEFPSPEALGRFRVLQALEAATEFSGGVRPPYTILAVAGRKTPSQRKPK